MAVLGVLLVNSVLLVNNRNLLELSPDHLKLLAT
jgi:hypothetical protein